MTSVRILSPSFARPTLAPGPGARPRVSETEVVGQGGRQHEAGFGHQPVVIETSCRGGRGCAMIASIGCSFGRVDGWFSTPSSPAQGASDSLFQHASNGQRIGGLGVRFLPDGGAPSGLLRSLATAITLLDSPEHFPAVRQGSTLLAALRGGVLIASAQQTDHAIVAVDDLGGEFDPFLARHLAAELRRTASQLIATTHAPDVAGAFPTSEVVRLYREQGLRAVARGKAPGNRTERISVRYLSSALVNAPNASVLVVVEGHHDRLGYLAVADRAVRTGKVGSFDAVAATFQEAEGDGEAAKLAEAAGELGIFTIVILDNDTGSPATKDAEVQACLAAADAVIRLPDRMALERCLLADVPDADLVKTFKDLDAAFADLVLPPGWEKLTGLDLQRVWSRFSMIVQVAACLIRSRAARHVHPAARSRSGGSRLRGRSRSSGRPP